VEIGILHNEKLRGFYKLCSIVRIVKSGMKDRLDIQLEWGRQGMHTVFRWRK
jgi:hypothetical protein